MFERYHGNYPIGMNECKINFVYKEKEEIIKEIQLEVQFNRNLKKS